MNRKNLNNGKKKFDVLTGLQKGIMKNVSDSVSFLVGKFDFRIFYSLQVLHKIYARQRSYSQGGSDFNGF